MGTNCEDGTFMHPKCLVIVQITKRISLLPQKNQYAQKDTTASIALANVPANRINSFVMPRTVAFVDKDSQATTVAN